MATRRQEPEASLLAWTTTPWTLPSNLALCVNPGMDYIKIRDKKTGKVRTHARGPPPPKKNISSNRSIDREGGRLVAGWLPAWAGSRCSRPSAWRTDRTDRPLHACLLQQVYLLAEARLPQLYPKMASEKFKPEQKVKRSAREEGNPR